MPNSGWNPLFGFDNLPPPPGFPEDQSAALPLKEKGDTNSHGYNPKHGHDPLPPPPPPPPKSGAAKQTTPSDGPTAEGNGSQPLTRLTPSAMASGQLVNTPWGQLATYGIPAPIITCSYLPMTHAYYYIVPAAIPAPTNTLTTTAITTSNNDSNDSNSPTTKQQAYNLDNHLGGKGLPPGWNYGFSAKHCPLLVIENGPAPWEAPAGRLVAIQPFYVPVETTMRGLLDMFGKHDEEKAKNRVVEVIDVGNGRWSRGWGADGSQGKKMAMTLAEVGWNAKRDGKGMPRVYVWVTDGED